jgi:integrase
VWQDDEGRRHEAVRSLGTKDPEAARVLALRLNLDHERRRQMSRLPNPADVSRPYKIDLDKGIAEATDDADHARMLETLRALGEAKKAAAPAVSPEVMDTLRRQWQSADDARMAQARAEFLAEHPNAYPSYTPAPVMRSKPLAEVIRMYLADKEGEITPEVMKAKARTFDGFLAFFEDDALTVAGLTRERAQLWKAGLKARKLAVKTVNDHISKLAALYAWAIDHGHATGNPFDGLKLKTTGKQATKSRDDFTNDDLKRIFQPATYLATFGKRPDFYWLPLVALLSGARGHSIGGLNAADVSYVDGVPCFFIQDDKTPDGRRRVPIHPLLHDLGFWDYVEAVQASGEPMLFPHVSKDKNGAGTTATQLFNRTLRNWKMSSRLTFHSFRHSVITRLHGLDANPAHVMQITGHAGEAKGVHFEVYAHGVGLQKLAAMLAKLNYPGVDFNALRLTGPTFSAYLKKWKAGAAHRARLAASKVKHEQAKAARKGATP